MQEIQSFQEIEELINNTEILMLYFSTPECSVCKVLKPKVEEMVEEFPNIVLRYIDLEKIELAKGKFSVFTIPTILMFINGKEFIREARYISVEDLRNKILRYYELYKN